MEATTGRERKVGHSSVKSEMGHDKDELESAWLACMKAREQVYEIRTNGGSTQDMKNARLVVQACLHHWETCKFHHTDRNQNQNHPCHIHQATSNVQNDATTWNANVTMNHLSNPWWESFRGMMKQVHPPDNDDDDDDENTSTSTSSSTRPAL